jgi:hypothetical protein
VLHSPASDTNVFPLRDTRVSSTSWIGLYRTKRAYLHLENTDRQDVFLFKTNSFLTGKQCGRYLCTNTDGFVWRDTCVSSTLLNRLIWNKDIQSPPKKTKLQEDFLSKTNSVLTGKLLLQHTQFFQEIHAFLQLSWIDLFGTKWAFQHLQNSDWQEIFLSKRVSILTRKKFARHSCF